MMIMSVNVDEGDIMRIIHSKDGIEEEEDEQRKAQSW